MIVLFGDDEAAEKILETSDPREQKALGRTVRNFDDTIWKEKCRDIVKRGNQAKVSSTFPLLLLMYPPYFPSSLLMNSS